MATRLVNRESVALGLADLRLGSSTANISSFGPVLTSDDYFGSTTEISFQVQREFMQRYANDGNIIYLADNLLTKTEVVIDITFIEVYNKTLSFVFGGDGTETDIFDAMVNNPGYLRAEMIFTYPNKVNTLTIILPKVQIVSSSVPMDFKKDDALQMPLQIKAVRTDHATWSTRPLGRSLFA